MRLEIVTVGDELLLGFTIDTNAAYLARELASLGVEVVRRATVPDDAGAIANAVGDALARSGAVITTGGLGPTTDDLTREAIAAHFGLALQLDHAIADDLRRRWRERGLPGELPESNIRQAMVPEGAEVLPNGHGTAPGLWITDEAGRWVAMLPGVPREMRGLYTDEVAPRIGARLAGGPAHVVRSKTIRTTGVAESVLSQQLANPKIGEALAGLSLAYLPGQAGADLRVTGRDLLPDDAEARLSRAVRAIRDVVGPSVYAEEETDLAAVVLDACRERGMTLAVAESCTGGLLGARLTAIPGSSDVVLGGVIAYANGVKQAMLGVQSADLDAFGAVSEPVARQMATGVRERLGADVGLSITGVAGPGGGTAEKPVGTVWFAIDVGGEVEARVYRFLGDRAEIRERAAQAVLDLLRRRWGRPESSGRGA